MKRNEPSASIVFARRLLHNGGLVKFRRLASPSPLLKFPVLRTSEASCDRLSGPQIRCARRHTGGTTIAHKPSNERFTSHLETCTNFIASPFVRKTALQISDYPYSSQRTARMYRRTNEVWTLRPKTGRCAARSISELRRKKAVGTLSKEPAWHPFAQAGWQPTETIRRDVTNWAGKARNCGASCISR